MLEDKEAIRELLHRYCFCMDEGRFVELLPCSPTTVNGLRRTGARKGRPISLHGFNNRCRANLAACIM